MLTAAEARRQRQALMRDIAREERRKKREELKALVRALKEARAARRVALVEAKTACRTGRQLARERVRELRMRALADLRDTVRAERAQAKSTCDAGLEGARSLRTQAERARAALVAERQFRRDMRRIERGNRERRTQIRAGTSSRERASEADDEVRNNLPPELLPLFERVKRSIKAGSRMSRLESFLRYAEEHPDEVLVSIEDKTEQLVRDLEKKERAAARVLRRSSPSSRSAAAGVPF